jgi:hypothetical protein
MNLIDRVRISCQVFEASLKDSENGKKLNDINPNPDTISTSRHTHSTSLGKRPLSAMINGDLMLNSVTRQVGSQGCSKVFIIHGIYYSKVFELVTFLFTLIAVLRFICEHSKGKTLPSLFTFKESLVQTWLQAAKVVYILILLLILYVAVNFRKLVVLH